MRQSEDSGDSNDLNTFLKQDIHHALQINPAMNDLDIIPNVGMDGLFSDEVLDNEEPLMFDGFEAPEEPDAFQIVKEEAARRAAQLKQAKSRDDQYGNIASSSSSDAQQSQKRQGPVDFLCEHSSDVKTTVSNMYSESSNNDKSTLLGGVTLSRDVTISDVDEDEEGDWDSEFILDKPDFAASARSHKTLALAGMRAQPKNPEPIALSTTASADKQEPLLEHLDACLKKKFHQTAGSMDSQEDAFRASFNDEEYKVQDSQHLKDLPLWILSTSAKLSSYLSDGRNKCSLAAVEAELRSMNSDPYFVEQLLERCEEDVTKDSTVFSLEIAVKWIQGTCLLMEKNKVLIHEDRLGRIFMRCEYLLGEASRSNLEKIVEYDNVLCFEINYIYEQLDAVPLLTNRSSVVSSAISCLTSQLSLTRLNVHMLQIKAHSKCTVDMESHLEQLELLWDELVVLRTRWLANLMLFLPPESPWTTPRERRQSSFAPISSSGALRRDEELRHLIIQKIYKAIDSSCTLSLYHHTHIAAEATVLLDLISELQACCLVDKLLVLTKRSPLTTMESRRTEDLFVELPCSPTTIKQGGRWGSREESGFSLRLSRTSSSRIAAPIIQASLSFISPIYNAAYEMSIGTQFVEMMLKLSSPSICRSKLAFAAFCYLREMQRQQLPWQQCQGRKVTLTRKARNAERPMLLRKGSSDISFGIDSDDIDYFAEDFTVADLEKAIYQAFSDALGPVDEVCNLQLLLYEAAVDVLPNFVKQSGNVKLVDINDAQLFHHATPALDIYQSIHDRVQNKGASSLFANISTNHPKNKAHSLPEQDQKAPSNLLQYELTFFCYSLTVAFSSAVCSNLSHCSISLVEISLLLAKHLDSPESDLLAYRKKIFLTACRLGNLDSAISHGQILFDYMLSHDSNWREVLFVAESLSRQLCLNAQYELSIQLHFRTLHYIRRLSLPCLSKDLAASQRIPQELLRFIDSFIIMLAKNYLNFGCPEKAASVLHKLLTKVSERPLSLRTDQEKVLILSYSAEAYLQMRDFESCNRIVRAVKIVRQQRIQMLMDRYFFQEGTATDRAAKPNVQSLHFLDYISQAGSSSSHHSMSAYFRSSSVDRPNNRALHASSASQNDEKGTPTESDAEPIAPIPLPDSLPDSASPEDKPQYTQVVRCMINNSDAILPRHCVSHHNVDLGHMLAKIYFESKLYLSALNSLIPTVMGCELLVGGKSGGKEGIHELGTLYYFRGLIQLEACRSSSELKYPCEVGSSQLFTAIQSISACVPPDYTIVTNKRCFIPPKDVRAEAVSKFEALHASVGDVRNVPKLAITCRRSVTYNSPSDMLWDAMKWFRRAWDFFHTAGDDINAARAANRIAECHLLPLFTQSALLNIPLDIAKDLTSNEGNSRLPQPNVNSLKLNREPFTKSTERMLSPLPPLAPTAQHSPLGRSSSWLEGPTGQTPKAAVKRYASLEEVERVTSFALDTHLEASLPIEIMESYLNFAELSCLQGNMNEAFPFWWETKDLFCYLFADGCLVPIIRRCTYDFLVKIEHILDRIVRFLWKLDQQIRNNHLFLLEMHVLFSVEKSRVLKAQARRARRCNKSLTPALRVCIVAANLQSDKTVSSGKAGKLTPLQRAMSMTKMAVNSADIGQPYHIEDIVHAEQPTTSRRRGIFRILREIFSCTSYRPDAAVRTPPEQRPQTLHSSSSMWRRSLSIHNSAETTTTSYTLLSLAEFDSEIQQAVGASTKIYSELLVSCVEDKVLDFGWSRFVDYDDMETAMRTSTANSKSLEEKRDFRIDLSINIPTSMLTRTLRYINVPTVLSKHILSKQDILDGGATPLEGGIHGTQRRPSGPGSRKQSPSTRYTHGQQSPSLQQMMATPVRDQQPLDPYEDFLWMDDSFSPHYFSASTPHRVRSELYLSESPVLCNSADERISARTKELLCEKALIQRVWSYFLKVSNACTYSHSRQKRASVASLNKVVRQSLSKVYQSMMRIRAFSRQFKSSMVDFHQLSDLLHTVPDFSDDPRINIHNNASIYLSAVKAQRFAMASKAVRLQERLTRMTYVVYINDVVMVYHPETGKDMVRRLGASNKFGPLAKSSKESPKSDIDSPASHFPFSAADHASPVASGIASIVQRADDSQMNMQQTALLFDYCVQDDDALCGGGLLDRQTTLNSFRSGSLSHLVQFMELCGNYTPTFVSDNISVAKDSTKSSVSHLSLDSKQSVGADTSGVMSSTLSAVTVGSGRSETRSLPHNHSSFFSASILGSIYFGESMLMRNTGERSGVTNISSNSASPPECPAPLTLICSHSLYSLPWEALLGSGSAVRSLCMLSSLSQVLGPRPCYLDDGGEETLQQSPLQKSETLPLAKKFSERFRPRRNTDDSSDSGVGSQSIAAGVNKGLLRGFLGPAWVRILQLCYFGLNIYLFFSFSAAPKALLCVLLLGPARPACSTDEGISAA
ncbi:hypothetical protein EON64_00295 [archaeon]|nr:MAG: hypothetical protein EON64_00295 [archaeon]